jgi:RimJ/RimL family protein N-acetyltransferase
MSRDPELRTPRLLLRGWRESDRVPFAALNADPVVMEYLPATLSRRQSDALMDWAEIHFVEHGFGLWAVELAAHGTFIGFVGLSSVGFKAHFTPAVEVGWRLTHRYWGKGYATEAARRAVSFGFEDLDLAEIVSFTSQANERSRRVMERLGMRREEADDFDHPHLGEDHPLRRHVLYRLDRSSWGQLRRGPPPVS